MVREPPYQFTGYIVCEKGLIVTMGSAALAEAAKSIRDWSLANGVHTPPAVKAAEVFGSLAFNDKLQQERLSKTVPRAESDDHARRATRHRDR